MMLKAIAAAFSNGSVQTAYPYFADNAQWRVIGEEFYFGKNAVIENCERLQNINAEGRRVAVIGTAGFIRDGRRVSYVSACDVYELMKAINRNQ